MGGDIICRGKGVTPSPPAPLPEGEGGLSTGSGRSFDRLRTNGVVLRPHPRPLSRRARGTFDRLRTILRQAQDGWGVTPSPPAYLPEGEGVLRQAQDGWGVTPSPPAPLPEGEGVLRQAQDERAGVTPSPPAPLPWERGWGEGRSSQWRGVVDVRMGFFRNWSKLALLRNTPVMRNRLKLRSMYIGRHFRRSLPAARRRLADGHRIGGATPNYPSTPHAIAGTALTPVPLATEAGTGHGIARSLSLFAMTEGFSFCIGAQRAVQDSKERLPTDNLKGDFVK